MLAVQTQASEIVNTMAKERRTLVIGVDVGTSGVRAVAASAAGKVDAEAEHPLSSDRRDPGGVHEQSPEDWWNAVCQSTQQIIKSLNESGSATPIAGAAVTSTSGTLVVTGPTGRPLRPALLYDDSRGGEIAATLNRQAAPGTPRLNASQSLVKAAWVQQTEPEVWARTRYLLHPADWLTGKLTGEFGISDYSDSLKLGYEPEYGTWSEAVARAGLPSELLPRIYRPGEQVGTVSSAAALETNLPPGTPVLVGATDGIASLLASGASQPGDANTTLGTTIVWKALATNRPRITGGVYCHLHPSGLWAPGAASNTGMGSLRVRQPGVSVAGMDHLAAAYLPSPIICYLLAGRGERFPFLNSQAETFLEGDAREPAEQHAAELQSIGFAERWGYEVLAGCGVEVGDKVFSTGAAAASSGLSQMRSNILNRVVVRAQHGTAAFGAAILAASGTIYAGDVTGAIQAMTKVAESFEPSPASAKRYDEIYAQFRQACTRRGYGV